MSGPSAPDRPTVRAALTVACRAPSLHNSQPWRWQLGDHSVHLFADDTRRLRATDPDGRQMLLSCGAALQHVRMAFAAMSWRTHVRRMPDPDVPNHLASLEFEQTRSVRARDVALATAAMRRRTDRRPYLTVPVPAPMVDRLVAAARAEGSELVVLREQADVQVAARLSDLEHANDTDHVDELARWTGHSAGGEGVPATALLAPSGAGRVLMARDFRLGRGVLPEQHQRRDGATPAILRTVVDERHGWLRAGEALGAVLLEATAVNLATCVLTNPTEIAESRGILERMAESMGRGVGWPQVVIRIGRVDTPLPGPVTPRRILDDVIERQPLAQ